MNTPLKLATLPLLSLTLALPASQAETVTWTGSTDADWSEDANWFDSVGFSDLDSILFSHLSLSNLATNNDLVGQTVTGITVTNPAGNVSIGGNTFSLGSGGITLSGDQNLTISAPITLTTAQEWNIAAGRQVTMDGTTITSGPTVPITLTGGGTLGFADGSPEQPNWEGGVVIEAGTLSSRQTTGENTVRQWLGTGLLSLQGLEPNSATVEIRAFNNANGS